MERRDLVAMLDQLHDYVSLHDIIDALRIICDIRAARAGEAEHDTEERYYRSSNEALSILNLQAECRVWEEDTDACL